MSHKEFTVLMGHFKNLRPDIRVGLVLEEGDLIGQMGTTGNSTGNHVHTTAAPGRIPRPFYRGDYDNGSIKPHEAETNSFIVDNIFKRDGKWLPALISYDYDRKSYNNFYQWRGDRYHFGVDLITSDSSINPPQVYWPKKVKGTVIAYGDDRNVTNLGYGIWVAIHYSYEEAPVTKRWDGIDLSEHQVLNWDTLSLSTDFAMIRAGVTLSESKTMEKDTRFDLFYDNLKKYNVPTGAYYYSVAETVAEAEKEAKFFLDLVKNKRFDYPLALDIEHDKHKALSKELRTQIIDTFGRIIEEAGYYFMVYSYLTFFEGTNREVLKKYDHWIADTRVGATRDSRAGIWQYSHKGRINGYSGDIDLNYGYMDYKEVISKSNLNNLDKVVEIPPVVKPNVPDYVTVRKGQTLWEIAETFGTTVNKLVELNNIANANLIYPGQKIYLKSQQKLYHTVVNGDTLNAIATRYKTTLNALLKLNSKIKNPDLIIIGDRIRVK